MKFNKNNKGFTLAEMLIVVAIIGVLISIVAVIIGDKVEQSREATDKANIRKAVELVSIAAFDDTYAEMINYNSTVHRLSESIGKVTCFKGGAYTYYVSTVKVTQKKAKWQSNGNVDRCFINNTAVDFPSLEKTKYYVIQYEVTNATGAIRWSIYVTNNDE